MIVNPYMVILYVHCKLTCTVTTTTSNKWSIIFQGNRGRSGSVHFVMWSLKWYRIRFFIRQSAFWVFVFHSLSSLTNKASFDFHSVRNSTLSLCESEIFVLPKYRHEPNVYAYKHENSIEQRLRELSCSSPGYTW